jgi:hypothetical protein
LSACRIVYVIDEKTDNSSENSYFSGPPCYRFGFAYGTLEDHVEKGEERFLIEWIIETDEVYFDIFSYSQQNVWFTKLGYPVARYFQNCFGKDCLKLMLKWVNNNNEEEYNYNKEEREKIEISIV